MQNMARSILMRYARSKSHSNFLPQSLSPISGLQNNNLSNISHEATNGTNDMQYRVHLTRNCTSNPSQDNSNSSNTIGVKTMASKKIKEQLADMFNDIHRELDAGILSDSQLTQLVK